MIFSKKKKKGSNFTSSTKVSGKARTNFSNFLSKSKFLVACEQAASLNIYLLIHSKCELGFFSMCYHFGISGLC